MSSPGAGVEPSAADGVLVHMQPELAAAGAIGQSNVDAKLASMRALVALLHNSKRVAEGPYSRALQPRSKRDFAVRLFVT